MTYKELKEPGIYKVGIKKSLNDIERMYLVTLTGESPFLDIDYVWDILSKRSYNKDVFRGKITNWEKVNL